MANTVLITGASRGIGAATARYFGEQGWQVAVHYHEREDLALELVRELREMGTCAVALGADLACTAVGAAEKYPLPAIIIDLGTATKITVVTEDRSFIGGAILPGVKISLEALSGSASLLPSIGLGTGKIKTIGSNTVDCMLSGVVLGTACMVDGLIERYREELGEVPTVVACGGLSPAIVPHCRTNIILDQDLLLDGLLAIYRRNAPPKQH